MLIRHEIIVKATVRQDKLLTKFIRSLRDKGASISIVDEVYRRVILKIPLLKYEFVAPLLKEYVSTASYEVRATLLHSLSATQLMHIMDYLRKTFDKIHIVKPEQSYTRILGLIKIDSRGSLIEIYPSRSKHRGKIIIRYIPKLVQMDTLDLSLLPPSMYTLNYTDDEDFKKNIRKAVETLNEVEDKIIKVIRPK